MLVRLLLERFSTVLCVCGDVRVDVVYFSPKLIDILTLFFFRFCFLFDSLAVRCFIPRIFISFGFVHAHTQVRLKLNRFPFQFLPVVGFYILNQAHRNQIALQK